MVLAALMRNVGKGGRADLPRPMPISGDQRPVALSRFELGKNDSLGSRQTYFLCLQARRGQASSSGPGLDSDL